MKKLRYWFYYCYFSVLTQPQLLKLHRGVNLASDRNGPIDKPFYLPVSTILGTINYQLIDPIAPYWWKGLRNYMMESCFEKYWSLRGGI